LALLVRELESNAGWGEIVGPHGSGKSTLLASLLPALTAWQVSHVRLSTTLRRLPTEIFEPSRPRSLLVIDGFEQLGYLTRRRVKRRCRQHGSGLLVTSHFSVGLPLLHRRESTPTEAMELITSLLPPGGKWVLAGFDISRRLGHHRGNLREVLFELYDRWEQGPPS
jgi:energy-coupling factor transporter ATP-binding protein EcfA2